MGDDVTIVITAQNGQAIRAFRDTSGQLRDMRGRFVAEGQAMSGAMNRVSRSADGAKTSVSALKGSIIPLAAAAAPLAASFAPIAAKAGGAALAMGVFGVAVAGQAASLKEAADAQKKYEDTVVKSGRGSQQAAEAQRQVAASLAAMPYGTARASVGFQTLKGDFQDWSDEISGFTMKPVEKSFAVMRQVIPQLTPMATGAADQLNRLVNVAGGAVASPGFDALSEKVSTFANESLAKAVTGVINFSDALASGEADGPIKAFMDYAEQNGPALRETLSTVGDAVTTLVEGAADAGPGMLTLVNAAAGLVAALPPELVTVLMQTAVGLKAVSLAGAAVAAVTSSRAAANLSGFVRSAQFGGVGPAIAGVTQRMSTLQKVGGSLGVLGAVALGINELAKKARGAPPDVDKLTDSLKELSASGRWSGELKSTFGDMDGFVDKLGKLKAESDGMERAKPFLAFSGLGAFADTAVTKIDDLVRGGESLGATKDDFKSFDEAFASMAKSGYGEQAADQFETFKKAALDSGMSLKDFKSIFPEYQSAVAGLKAEQELTAQSMGIFGQASLDTSAKLEAQQKTADGLRASILALNDVNRSAYDAQIGFEEGLDNLTASFKEHGATLNLDTEAGRANATAMSAAAAAQDEMIATGLAAGESLGSMVGKSDELRESMMRLATDAFDGNKAKATEYVNTLLGVPSEIKTMITAEKEEAISGLHDVQSAIEATPGAKSIKVDALNGAAIAALEAVGLKTKRLPDGRTLVTTANGQSLGAIGAVSSALSRLNGRTASTYVTTYYSYKGKNIAALSAGRMATGGVVRGPGTDTSDSVPIMASNDEFIVNAKSSRAHRRLLEAINEDRLPRFAKGGSVTKSEKEARAAARGDLTISNFGQRAGYKNTEFVNAIGKPDSVGSLVSALNSWRSTIMKSTHGRTESRLLTQLNVAGRAMIKYEKNLTSVNKSLEKAKDKLDDLKSSASSLSTSVKSGILSGANITKAAGGEGQVTINTLLSQMQGSAGNAKQFSGMLTSLKKKGLRGDLIEQIGEAGIDGGGMETAAAILGGGTSEIKKLNELQKQIGSYATAAGKTTADAMYGAGIRAAEGLVKGLDSQKKKIESQMMQLAKYMEKSIKKALGIKSPSTVMEEVGDYTAEGFAVGVQKNRSVQPAWASMLNVPRGGTMAPKRADAAVGGAAGGDRPIVLNVSLGGREFGQIWVDVGRKEVSTRGGLKAALGGMP
ncbi:phage tail protein [Streptomyces umbrinus]|uniref:phage tail protein n=1 Tax=Streptomyces umbrinus TaxID=67370 RepID=UPI003C2F22B1